MELKLQRSSSHNGFTAGELFINGVHECFTCEDVIREVPGKPVSEWKVPHETAIPSGHYKVIITLSARFQRDLPLLVNVPGFDGIRIHPGNRAGDTEGCLLPGQQQSIAGVVSSQAAFGALFPKIKDALDRQEDVSIAILNP